MNRLLSLAALVAFAAAGTAQEPAPGDPSALPPPEVTQKRVDSLSEGFANIETLGQRLEQLGNPSRREPGESTEEYLDRVDQILKGRALYVHLLHQQLESALEAKYAIEAYLDEYQTWTENLAKTIQLDLERYHRQAAAVESQSRDMEQDVVVLAHLIQAEARRAGNDALAERMDGIYDQELLGAVTDRAAREEKFRPLELTAKQDRLNEMINTIKDNRFRSDLLRTTVLPEVTEFQGILPDEHVKAINAIKQALGDERNRQTLLTLEDQAARVSIIAEYVRDGLKFVRPDAQGKLDVTRMAQLNQQNPQVQKALDDYLKLSGGGASNLEAGGDFKTFLKQRRTASLTTEPGANP